MGRESHDLDLALDNLMGVGGCMHHPFLVPCICVTELSLYVCLARVCPESQPVAGAERGGNTCCSASSGHALTRSTDSPSVRSVVVVLTGSTLDWCHQGKP